jgi:hypothetical protein
MFLTSWSRLHRGQPALVPETEPAFASASQALRDRRKFDALAKLACSELSRQSAYFQVVSRLAKLRFYARLLSGAPRLQTVVLRVR